MTGWIYVMSNEAMPAHVKVGVTTRDPEERARELDNTALPYPCSVEYAAATHDIFRAERLAHSEMRTHRARKNREWFECDVATAEEIVSNVAERLQAEVVKRRPGDAESVRRLEEERRRRQEEYNRRTEKQILESRRQQLLREKARVEADVRRMAVDLFPEPRFITTYILVVCAMAVGSISISGSAGPGLAIGLFYGWIPGAFIHYFRQVVRRFRLRRSRDLKELNSYGEAELSAVQADLTSVESRLSEL